VTALLPIFAWLALGMVLRSAGVADQGHARIVFRVVFLVTLPVLAFVSVSGQTLTAGNIALPLVGFLVNLACAALALVYARAAQLRRDAAGAVIVGAGITNMVFMFPFIAAALGPDALAKAILYDIGNSIFVATVAYSVATRFGESAQSSLMRSVGRTAASPLFLAVIAALVVSATRIEVPPLVETLLTPLGRATMPLVLVALGVSISGARLRDAAVIATVLIRMVGGLAAGLLIVSALGFDRNIAVVVIASAAAPIGFNAVTLASIGRLDTDRAAASLSVSILVGVVTATLIVLAGRYWMSTAS
jgi:predicted permease